MIKDFKILDNILGFWPRREPSVPAALNAASAIQSDFYLAKKETSGNAWKSIFG